MKTILNNPGLPNGTIDSREIAVPDGITGCMAVEGEANFETRPWNVYSQGPNMVKQGSLQ